MAKSMMQVSEVGMEVPMTGKSFDVDVSSAVVDLSSVQPLDAQCTSVRLCFTGAGDVRVRMDGSNPSSASGEIWFQGGILKLNREQYNLVKVIRSDATDSAIHGTQMTGGRLR